MKRIICLVVVVLAAGIAACSSNPSASTSGGGAGATKYIPGTLRVADIEEPDTLNPYISTVITTIDMSYLWGEYFFNVDDKNQFVPEVATEVPTLKNGGIRFSMYSSAARITCLAMKALVSS